MTKRRGLSYQKRVAEVNRIYDQYARSGLTNREIWRRYIYPVFFISERTFYNMMNATAVLTGKAVESDVPTLFDYMDDHPKEKDK